MKLDAIFIPQDKANHFIWGQTMFVVFALIIWKVTGHYNWAYWGAELGVIIVGGLKEWFDRQSNKKAIAAGLSPPHGVEGWDWMATALGGVSVWIVAKFL